MERHTQRQDGQCERAIMNEKEFLKFQKGRLEREEMFEGAKADDMEDIKTDRRLGFRGIHLKWNFF